MRASVSELNCFAYWLKQLCACLRACVWWVEEVVLFSPQVDLIHLDMNSSTDGAIYLYHSYYSEYHKQK